MKDDDDDVHLEIFVKLGGREFVHIMHVLVGYTIKSVHISP